MSIGRLEVSLTFMIRNDAGAIKNQSNNVVVFRNRHSNPPGRLKTSTEKRYKKRYKKRDIKRYIVKVGFFFMFSLTVLEPLDEISPL